MIGVGLYVKNSIKAVETYISAFGFELGYHVLNADGTYFHSELNKDGEEMLAVVEANRDVHESPVQLGYNFTTREELEHAFNILKQDGTVQMEIGELPWSPCAAEVTDCFGVNWYLTLPQHRPDEDFNPNN